MDSLGVREVPPREILIGWAIDSPVGEVDGKIGENSARPDVGEPVAKR